MRCINSIEELKENMATLDNYLDSKCGSEYPFALSLIKKGTCFIAVENENGYRFYPSRFIGYANNTMFKHMRNMSKDGKVTNPIISEILNQKPELNEKIETLYQKYCENLGFTPNKKGAFGVDRKYWVL